MKKKELEQYLKGLGFFFIRSKKHDIFSNGTMNVSVPRHKEIKSWTVNQIKKQIGAA